MIGVSIVVIGKYNTHAIAYSWIPHHKYNDENTSRE